MRPWFRSALSKAPHSKAALSPSAPLVALQLTGQARWTPRDYSALAREGYQRNAPAYRCIRMIAEAAASVPLCVRRGGQCLPGDPAAKLLAAPNPKISRAEFFEAHYGYLQLSGNAYLEAVLVGDAPAALFALPPQKMSAIVGANGWPTAWQYDTGGRQKRFAIDTATGRSALHHMRLFHPTDDIYGFSPLEAAAGAVDIHNAGGLWTKSLLDNSARPSGALVYNAGSGSDRLSDEQFARLKDELETGHSGARAAGRPLLLEGGLDWKAMSLSPADMDFINARREAAREIALAFGVPPMLLGIPGDNTYANYKEANLAFWRQTILPLVRKTADSLEGWLRPWFGEDLDIHAETDDIAALAEERAQNLTALNGISFMSDIEKRERAGLEYSAEGVRT